MLPHRAVPKTFARSVAQIGAALLIGYPLASAADDLTLSHSFLQTPSIDDLIGQRETNIRSLGITLDKRRWSAFAPGAVNFTVRSRDGQDLAGRVMETYSPYAAREENGPAYTISAGWGTPDDRITFSFTTRNADAGTPGLFVTEPLEDIFSLSHSLVNNGWSTVFTASIGNSRHDEFGGRTQKLGASASFLKTTDWSQQIGITAKIYQGLHTNPGQTAVEHDTSWELRTGSNLLFGRASSPKLALPSLSIFFSVKGNTPEQTDTDSGDVDVTTGVAGKVHF